jgi:hypothetical protein
MAFNLEPPKDVTNLFRLWNVQIDQHLCSLICMGANAILWSIWLFRNEGIFDKKTTILLFAGCFQGNLLDPFLERLTKEEWQAFSEVGMWHDGDRDYGNFRQAWMVVAEKA